MKIAFIYLFVIIFMGLEKVPKNAKNPAGRPVILRVGPSPCPHLPVEMLSSLLFSSSSRAELLRIELG